MQMALEESAHSNDTITEIDGIRFIVAPVHEPYFRGVKLDYKKGFLGFGRYQLVRDK